MSKLETRVKPIIGPSICDPGRSLALTPEDQRTVATWSVKTSLMVQAILRKDAQYRPADNLRWFRDYRHLDGIVDPPPLSHVWMFLRHPVTLSGHSSILFGMTMAVGAEPEHSGAAVSSTSGSPDPNGHVTTFGVGYLGFQVFGQDLPIEGQTGLIVDAEYAHSLSNLMIPIWPTVPPHNRWPPKLIIGPADLDRLGRWGQPLEGPWPRRLGPSAL